MRWTASPSAKSGVAIVPLAIAVTKGACLKVLRAEHVLEGEMDRGTTDTVEVGDRQLTNHRLSGPRFIDAVARRSSRRRGGAFRRALQLHIACRCPNSAGS